MVTQTGLKNTPIEDDDGNRMVEALKNTATMLISAVQFLAEDHEQEKQGEFRRSLDEEARLLATGLPPEALKEAHRRLKRLIFENNEREKLHREKQLTEYSRIANTLAEGLGLLSSNNIAFTDRMDTRLRSIQGIVDLENLRQIRAQMSEQIGQLKRLVQDKKTQEVEQQKSLVTHIQTLNSQLDDTLRSTRIDGLTGTYNRRAFDEHLEKLLPQLQQGATNFSLTLLDVDHFKTVNDKHGHQIGDRLLMAVVQKAKQSLRQGDFMARYGGDEFAIILHSDSLTTTRKILERLRLIVAQGFLYRKEDGTDVSLQVTISVGVGWAKPSDTMSALIERADKSLYLAKTRGRNQICTEDDLLNAE